MSKHIAFDIDEKLHKKMKLYLYNLEEEKTIKSYITELVEKDLQDKEILEEQIRKKQKEEEEGFE